MYHGPTVPRRGPYRARTPLGRLRARHGLTLEEAARKLKVGSRSHLNLIEQGRARPGAEMAQRMASLYGVTEADILRLAWLAAHLVLPNISG